MSAARIDGTALAAALRALEEPRARALLAARGRPARAVLFVRPADAASRRYQGVQARALARAGVGRVDVEEIGEAEDGAALVLRVARASAAEDVVAVSVHQPLPRGVDALAVLTAVAPARDLEGTHPESLGRLSLGAARPAPCAAQAALVCLRAALPDLRGRRVVVVGRSPLLGRPLVELLLTGPDAPTVVVCHTGTPDLAAETRAADALIVAAGRPGLITAAHVRPGAVVVDCGSPAGDVDEAVAGVAGALTPVPGGVGPVCGAMLVANLVACLERQALTP